MLSEKSTAYLQNICIKYEGYLEKVDEGLLYKEELQSILNNDEREIRNKFEEGSDEFRIWRNVEINQTLWKIVLRPGDKPALATVTEKEEIQKKIKTIVNILERNSKEVVKNTVIFSAQQQYSAKKYIFTLFKSTKKSIAIVDEYLDETIFPYLDTLGSKVSVTAVTYKANSAFKSLLKSYKIQNPDIIVKKVHFKESSHSRYLIIDDSLIYHLGASINSIDGENMKSFSIQVVTDEEAKKEIIKNLTQWIDGGKDIE